MAFVEVSATRHLPGRMVNCRWSPVCRTSNTALQGEQIHTCTPPPSRTLATVERSGDGAEDGVDRPMEVLKDGGAILAAMKAHPSDARVQESGWRSLIAMDTGRGDVEKFFSTGDAQERGREMLRDCIERHGGDTEVAGQVAAMLQRLVIQGDGESGK